MLFIIFYFVALCSLSTGNFLNEEDLDLFDNPLNDQKRYLIDTEKTISNIDFTGASIFENSEIKNILFSNVIIRFSHMNNLKFLNCILENVLITQPKSGMRNITFENVQFIDSTIDQLNRISEDESERIVFNMKGKIYVRNTTFTNMMIQLNYDLIESKNLVDLEFTGIKFVDTYFKTNDHILFGQIGFSLFYNCDFFDNGVKIFNSKFLKCNFKNSEVLKEVNIGNNEYSSIISIYEEESTPACLHSITTEITLNNVISDNAIILPCDLNKITINGENIYEFGYQYYNSDLDLDEGFYNALNIDSCLKFYKHEKENIIDLNAVDLNQYKVI